MTGAQLGLGILVGVIVLILLVSVVTVMITKLNSKGLNDIHNVYLGKLVNSDASIQNAMKYLELTNGIKQQLNGETK